MANIDDDGPDQEEVAAAAAAATENEAAAAAATYYPQDGTPSDISRTAGNSGDAPAAAPPAAAAPTASSGRAFYGPDALSRRTEGDPFAATRAANAQQGDYGTTTSSFTGGGAQPPAQPPPPQQNWLQAAGNWLTKPLGAEEAQARRDTLGAPLDAANQAARTNIPGFARQADEAGSIVHGAMEQSALAGAGIAGAGELALSDISGAGLSDLHKKFRQDNINKGMNEWDAGTRALQQAHEALGGAFGGIASDESQNGLTRGIAGLGFAGSTAAGLALDPSNVAFGGAAAGAHRIGRAAESAADTARMYGRAASGAGRDALGAARGIGRDVGQTVDDAANAGGQAARRQRLEALGRRGEADLNSATENYTRDALLESDSPNGLRVRQQERAATQRSGREASEAAQNRAAELGQQEHGLSGQDLHGQERDAWGGDEFLGGDGSAAARQDAVESVQNATRQGLQGAGSNLGERVAGGADDLRLSALERRSGVIDTHPAGNPADASIPAYGNPRMGPATPAGGQRIPSAPGQAPAAAAPRPAGFRPAPGVPAGAAPAAAAAAAPAAAAAAPAAAAAAPAAAAATAAKIGRMQSLGNRLSGGKLDFNKFSLGNKGRAFTTAVGVGGGIMIGNDPMGAATAAAQKAKDWAMGTSGQPAAAAPPTSDRGGYQQSKGSGFLIPAKGVIGGGPATTGGGGTGGSQLVTGGTGSRVAPAPTISVGPPPVRNAPVRPTAAPVRTAPVAPAPGGPARPGGPKPATPALRGSTQVMPQRPQMPPGMTQVSADTWRSGSGSTADPYKSFNALGGIAGTNQGPAAGLQPFQQQGAAPFKQNPAVLAAEKANPGQYSAAAQAGQQFDLNTPSYPGQSPMIGQDQNWSQSDDVPEFQTQGPESLGRDKPYQEGWAQQQPQQGYNAQAPHGGNQQVQRLNTQMGSDTQGISNQLASPGQPNDVLGIFLSQGRQVQAMLNQQEQAARQNAADEGKAVDPATEATFAKMKDTFDLQLQQVKEDLARRGLYDSGVELEMESKLRKGMMSDQATIMGQRLTNIQQNMFKQLEQINTARSQSAQQFGLSGADALAKAQQFAQSLGLDWARLDETTQANIARSAAQNYSTQAGMYNNDNSNDRAQYGVDAQTASAEAIANENNQTQRDIENARIAAGAYAKSGGGGSQRPAGGGGLAGIQAKFDSFADYDSAYAALTEAYDSNGFPGMTQSQIQSLYDHIAARAQAGW